MRYLAATALILLAFASARPVCACTTKAQAYRNALKSDLRTLVTAEEAFRADSGRYSDDLAALRFTASAGATVEVTSVDDRGWTAVARHAVWKGSCTLTIGPEAPPGKEGVPLCEGAVYNSSGNAIEAGVCLLVFLWATATVSVAGLRGRGPWWPMIPLGLLLLVNPSWALLASAARGTIPGSGDCGATLQSTALLFAGVAVLLLWLQRRRMRSDLPSLTERSA